MFEDHPSRSRRLPHRRWLYPLALLLVLLLLAFAAPVAHAQAGEGTQEPAAGNDTAGDLGDAGGEQEATGFEDEAGQAYGVSLILAIAAIGVVIAVVLVKQHWRTRGRP